MFEWIKENAQLLSVAVNAGTLLIWLFYAQLLYRNYRRARRPRIIINHGIGTGAAAHCLVSNMSQEPIFVECIIATLETPEGEKLTRSVTDYEHTGDGTPSSALHDRTGQGPLKTGEYLDLGSFEQIAARVLRGHGMSSPDGPRPFQAIDVYVVAIYGPEDRPVASTRRFELRQAEQAWQLRSATIDSVALTSRRDRRRVRGWLERYML